MRDTKIHKRRGNRDLETIQKNICGDPIIIAERNIYQMQATVYPGLNEETDFSPF